MNNHKSFQFCLAALMPLISAARADVGNPPKPPPVPAGYCSTIYNEVLPDLQAFNLLLKIPPTWTPVSDGPTKYGANLQTADASAGPQISNSTYLTTVINELTELKAMGVQAVSVPVGFPVLYAPFIGTEAEFKPYLDFYANVAQAVRAAGLTLIVDNEVLLSNSVESGWGTSNPTPSAFFSSLNWPEYMAGRATMAATIATTMQPDYLILADEPDTEANASGQQNLNNPTDAAQMIQGEINAVNALNMSTPPKMGAGFGTWMGAYPPSGLLEYTDAYVALPLDYIDIHIFPVNTEGGVSLIGNALTVASLSAAAGKPIALGQAWAWKMENSEWGVLQGNDFRARDPLSFWAPLDSTFLQTVQSLAAYTKMVYSVPEGPNYFFAYQTYDGTAANGGAATCSCTVESGSCSDSDILHEENALADAAYAVPEFTTTGFAYYGLLVDAPDKTPPSTPSQPVGTTGYYSTNISWNASTDRVGVAGYEVYRCSPKTPGGSCTGVQIATTTQPSFRDSGLTSNTLYNYRVRAFDLANNNSPPSPALRLQTAK